MHYIEYAAITVNQYRDIRLPLAHITNTALELYIHNLFRDIKLISRHKGNSITFDLEPEYTLFTIEDIKDIFIYNGFKVILSVNSELKNNNRITVIWHNELFNNTLPGEDRSIR